MECGGSGGSKVEQNPETHVELEPHTQEIAFQ